MPNHLISENSPYLLQHAHNPVDWYPWGAAAFEKAKQEDKPIFLSIGYASCHWCHVMAHESFEDENTAAFLNQHFVSIKVDREERPDIDSIYMNAVVALSGHGGWPLSVFLTPDGKPFYGGTYFPPSARYRLPSFMDVLRAIHEAWTTKRQSIEEATEQIFTALKQQYQALLSPASSFEVADLETATERLIQSYDWEYGGWGKAPKFPQPIAIEFLIRRYSKNPRSEVRNIIEHVLDRMSRGGMYDLIEGGFCRYSTDNRWFIPHFEKMLYDNAQLGIVYLYAYLITKKAQYKRIVEQIVNFLLKNMRDESGLFYSSMDADSEGEEGKYYTITLDALRSILSETEYEVFLQTHHLMPLESNPHLMVFQAIENPHLDHNDQSPLYAIYEKLRSHRLSKVRPHLDDKCILSWNGLLLRFFAEASKYLDRQQYLGIATSLASAVKRWFVQGESLYRIKRGEVVSTPALLEDYASVIIGLISLYEVSGDTEWYELSQHLSKLMREKFSDPNGGFYDVPADEDQLILRPKELQDTATPSANALALRALLSLSILEGSALDWLDQVSPFIGSITEMARRYPLSFSSWLILIDMTLSDLKEIVLIGSPEELSPFFASVWSSPKFDCILCFSDLPLPPNAPPIMQDRTRLHQKPTAYICSQGVCNNPTTEVQEFDTMLHTQKLGGAQAF